MRRCGGEAPVHEIKREKKTSKDWRITPCSRRVFGFTPREAVAMITSCEGMAADPAESTDCPTFVRRRACSAAVARERRTRREEERRRRRGGGGKEDNISNHQFRVYFTGFGHILAKITSSQKMILLHLTQLTPTQQILHPTLQILWTPIIY